MEQLSVAERVVNVAQKRYAMAQRNEFDSAMERIYWDHTSMQPKKAPANSSGAEPVQCLTNKGQNTGEAVGN